MKKNCFPNYQERRRVILQTKKAAVLLLHNSSQILSQKFSVTSRLI